MLHITWTITHFRISDQFICQFSDAQDKTRMRDYPYLKYIFLKLMKSFEDICGAEHHDWWL